MSAGASEPPAVLQPRGRISKLLPKNAPLPRRFARGFVRLVEGIYHHDDIFTMAPAMAFHFFLSLLPLLVFIGYVVGLVAQSDAVSAVFALLIESANLPAASRQVVGTELGRLAAADRLGPIAAIGFLWIASGGIQGLMQAIERVVGAPRRVWWRQRMLAVAWVLGTMAAFAVAALGSIQWETVTRWEDTPDDVTLVAGESASDPPAHSASAAEAHAAARTEASRPRHRRAGKEVRAILRGGGERVLAMLFSLTVAVAGLAGFYQFSIAHSRRVRRRVFPGAFLAIALVIIVSWGFSFYVRTLQSYTLYYGGLAAIAVLMIWLWMASLAILVGAELNSQLEGLRD